MKKRLAVAAAMTAAFAFSMVGTASAGTTCPPAGATGEAPAEVTGTDLVPTVNATNPGVAGSIAGVGYGQAHIDVANLGYTGSLNGTGIGYGDVDGDLAGTPNGQADGEVAGVASAGSLNQGGVILTVDVGNDGADCISVP